MEDDWKKLDIKLEEYLDRKEKAKDTKALGTMVGGTHYLNYKIQPFEFFFANQVPFHKADIIKRILRYDLETGKGLEDLMKIIHEVNLIIELGDMKDDRT